MDQAGAAGVDVGPCDDVAATRGGADGVAVLVDAGLWVIAGPIELDLSQGGVVDSLNGRLVGRGLV